ncbi:MAG: tyrosine-type recombinase/integrase [Bryobacteraceae bacterium]
MRRKRFQKGSIRARKHGRVKVWVAQWREDGAPRTRVLGPCAEINKGQAEVMLAQILQPVNAEAGRYSVAAFCFKQYVEDSFLPVARSRWKESTRSTSESDILRYLIPEFGQQPMKVITREQMQRFLGGLAERLGASVVGHLRWHLNAIFRMAVSDGVVPFNPAEALFTPACKQAEMKRVMSGDEVRLALGVLDLRPRLMFRMAVFDGMRPGEILAIRLGKIGPNQVLIDQRIYGGKLDTPKGRKGKNTTRRVALSPGTMGEVAIWNSFLSDRSLDAFLFPSETGTTPLRMDNLWKREFKPRLETVGLGWVNFQVFRRTNASLSRKANIDDKVSADQRGHGLGVSLGVYAISDLEQKIEAVRKLEFEVVGDVKRTDLALTQ